MSSYRSPTLKTTIRGDVLLGYLFFAPAGYGHGQNTPVISSKDGTLLWHGASESLPFAATGLQQQNLHSRSVLTYWSGELVDADLQQGYGNISILENMYNEIYTVSLADDNFVTRGNESYSSYIDIHEDFLTDRGSIVVTATNITQADLTSVGGPLDGWIIDSFLDEIDLATNKVLFKWSSFDHVDEIPLNDSRLPLNGTGTIQDNPWNYFVLNSAQRFGDQYIISGRYYCSVYLIGPQGDFHWQLDVSSLSSTS